MGSVARTKAESAKTVLELPLSPQWASVSADPPVESVEVDPVFISASVYHLSLFSSNFKRAVVLPSGQAEGQSLRLPQFAQVARQSPKTVRQGMPGSEWVTASAWTSTPQWSGRNSSRHGQSFGSLRSWSREQKPTLGLEYVNSRNLILDWIRDFA